MTAIGAPSGGGVGRGRRHASRSAVGASTPNRAAAHRTRDVGNGRSTNPSRGAAADAHRRAAARQARRFDGGTSRLGGVLTGALTLSRRRGGVLTRGVLKRARAPHPKTARPATGGGNATTRARSAHSLNRRPGSHDGPGRIRRARCDGPRRGIGQRGSRRRLGIGSGTHRACVRAQRDEPDGPRPGPEPGGRNESAWYRSDRTGARGRTGPRARSAGTACSGAGVGLHRESGAHDDAVGSPTPSGAPVIRSSGIGKCKPEEGQRNDRPPGRA
jgi:hypothetical protein